jgi:hypothetical protein
MEDKSKRRRRISDKNRLKKKARSVYKDCEEPHIYADNLRVCSCDLCRSPRKSRLCKGESKLTLQERRAKDKMGNVDDG